MEIRTWEKSSLREGARRVAWRIAIVCVGVFAGMGVSWQLPEWDLAIRDALMRYRGTLPPPPEIALIAIDEASISRLGRFPWPRSLMAQGLDRLAAAKPKVIAIDVLYADPTEAGEDRALASAIARAGNVVVAAQLAKVAGENGEPRVAWVRPLPEIERAAGGIGHVNVTPGYDGIVRSLLLQQADDGGEALWALAAMAIFRAEQDEGGALRLTPESARIGFHDIPLDPSGDALILRGDNREDAFDRLRPARLALDYLGPAGSFAGQTYSFADLLSGKIEPARLRGKYVVIGATAAALGERLATPFSFVDKGHDLRSDAMMPGVEILAHSISTILRDRFYREVPDWLLVVLTALAAIGVSLLLDLSQGRHEGRWQLAIVAGSILSLAPAAYLSFRYGQFFLPAAPFVASILVTALLFLLRRSLILSVGLDAQIAGLISGESRMEDASRLSFGTPRHDPAPAIARLCGARAVAVMTCDRKRGRHPAVVYGAKLRGGRLARASEPEAARSISQAFAEETSATEYFMFDQDVDSEDLRAIVLCLGGGLGEQPGKGDGELILAYAASSRPENDCLLVGREIAKSYLAAGVEALPEKKAITGALGWWPRGAAWKSKLLSWLQLRIMMRSLFVERALCSIDDGLLMATVEGCIMLANPRAAAILGVPEHVLVGSDLFERLSRCEQKHPVESGALTPRETLYRLLIERLPVESEVRIHHGRASHYILRLSAVAPDSRAAGAALGIVASLSDVTRQHELQKAKNDVMALVTHELRTPLTAIQGISEVLSKYEIESQRRFEMHLAINEESKRLARMIDEYLDLTRLETGARRLRPESLRVPNLLERILLLLEPVAADRQIRIVRRLAPNLPALVADADLVTRAITNLLANAVKFSPPRGEVILEASAENGFLRIDVRDQGCGIPAEAIPFIFEKFYRVPRTEDADAPGTGMGLAFVRDIAQLHGGGIRVESELGVGSVFTLRLPFDHNLSDSTLSIL